MLLEVPKWLFVNLMVAFGIKAAAAIPNLVPQVQNTDRYPWRDVTAYALMAVFCILVPWSPQPGIQLDLRNVVIGLAGWTHGLRASLPVATVAVAVRLLIGGAGAWSAMASAAFAVLVVPIFRRLPRNRLWLGVLGILQAVALMVAFQVLVDPRPDWAHPASAIWPTVAVAYFFSYLMLNHSHGLVHEMARLREVLANELRAKEALLELIPYGMVLVNDDHRAAGLNQAGRALLVNHQVPGPILEHPEIEQALRLRRRIIGCPVSLPIDGRESVALVSAVPVAHGALLGIQNVTNVVHQEREAAQHERLQLLGQLAAMAAHEIKNPLTTIKGFLQLLERREEFNAHRPSFTLLQGEVEHINQVVSDFLVLSGQESKRPVSVDVDTLLLEVIDVMRIRHSDSAVEVSLLGEKGLLVTADRKSLMQILKNLAANAFEAMPSGGALRLVRERVGDLVRISVVDSGQGIRPDLLPLIFRPYMTTKETGTGLGLAISHKLASEMGGSLGVESEHGKGSAFSLLLPRDAAVPDIPVADAVH